MSEMYVLDGKTVRPARDVAEYIDEMTSGPKLILETEGHKWSVRTHFTGDDVLGLFETRAGRLELFESYANNWDDAVKLHWTKVAEYSKVKVLTGRFMAFMTGE